MNKIVLGIIIMSILLGGLGVGFVAGYEYRCMKEEQFFDELFTDMNEEWGCSCYYSGDMYGGFRCVKGCAEDRLEMEEENLKNWGVLYCEFNNQDWTCEKIRSELERAESCAICDQLTGWQRYETEEEFMKLTEWLSRHKGETVYIRILSPEDYEDLVTFCTDWGSDACGYVLVDTVQIGGE